MQDIQIHIHKIERLAGDTLAALVEMVQSVDWDKIITRGVMGDAYWKRMQKKDRARARYLRMMERRGLLKHKGDKP